MLHGSGYQHHHVDRVEVHVLRVCTVQDLELQDLQHAFAREAVYVLPSSLAFAIMALDSGSTLFFSLSRICAASASYEQGSFSSYRPYCTFALSPLSQIIEYNASQVADRSMSLPICWDCGDILIQRFRL